jgi:hypothetical protein
VFIESLCPLYLRKRPIAALRRSDAKGQQATFCTAENSKTISDNLLTRDHVKSYGEAPVADFRGPGSVCIVGRKQQ